mmetsp:Transcript_110601/g.253288  ORF Transcript_110601/g.253288 Transcript_110601/m.253288 type:complete len:725 (+) Transcript_110601:23-2197(+)
MASSGSGWQQGCVSLQQLNALLERLLSGALRIPQRAAVCCGEPGARGACWCGATRAPEDCSVREVAWAAKLANLSPSSAATSSVSFISYSPRDPFVAVVQVVQNHAQADSGVVWLRDFAFPHAGNVRVPLKSFSDRSNLAAAMDGRGKVRSPFTMNDVTVTKGCELVSGAGLSQRDAAGPAPMVAEGHDAVFRDRQPLRSALDSMSSVLAQCAELYLCFTPWYEAPSVRSALCLYEVFVAEGAKVPIKVGMSSAGWADYRQRGSSQKLQVARQALNIDMVRAEATAMEREEIMMRILSATRGSPEGAKAVGVVVVRALSATFSVGVDPAALALRNALQGADKPDGGAMAAVQALGAVLCAADGKPMAADALLAAGADMQVLALIDRFMDTPSVVTMGAGAMACLATAAALSEDNCKTFCLMAVRCLKVPKQSANALTACMTLLWKLCDRSRDLQQLVFECGAAPGCLEAMAAHPENAGTQLAAMWLLFVLADGAAGIAQEIVDGGGAKLIVSALERFSTESGVQYHGSQVIWVMVDGKPSIQDSFLLANAHIVLLQALAAESFGATVKVNVTWALRALSEGRDAVVRDLVMGEAVSIIVGNLKQHVDNDRLVHIVVVVLWSLWANYFQAQREAVKCDAVGALIATLKQHRQHVGIVATCIGALRALCGVAEVQEALRRQGGARVVQDAVLSHPDELPIQAAGETILQILGPIMEEVEEPLCPLM